MNVSDTDPGSGEESPRDPGLGAVMHSPVEGGPWPPPPPKPVTERVFYFKEKYLCNFL